MGPNASAARKTPARTFPVLKKGKTIFSFRTVAHFSGLNSKKKPPIPGKQKLVRARQVGCSSMQHVAYRGGFMRF